MDSPAMQLPVFESVPTDRERHDDQRKRNEDLTCRPVARVILAFALPVILERLLADCPPLSADSPLEVIDVGAGFGCWSSELANHWVHVLLLPREWLRITAVEIDASKREHLARWCDVVLVGETAGHWKAALDRPYHLAIGNPPFDEIIPEDPDAPKVEPAPGKKRKKQPIKDPAESMPARLLARAPAVLLFHQVQSFQRSEMGCKVWRAYPPEAEWKVPGTVKFRKGKNPENGKTYGADSLCYQATLWRRGYVGPSTATMLPWLPVKDRQWEKPPGTETDEEAIVLKLPMAPAYLKRKEAA